MLGYDLEYSPNACVLEAVPILVLLAGTSERLASGGCLSFASVAVIKYSDKNKCREKGIILAHGSMRPSVTAARV